MVSELVGRFLPCYVRQAGGDIIIEAQISLDGEILRIHKLRAELWISHFIR
jgi:hypothetical protein